MIQVYRKGSLEQSCSNTILALAIVLADEPRTNLDVENFATGMDTFVDLKRKQKRVIIATHDDPMSKISDKVYEIFDYKINEIFGETKQFKLKWMQ